MIEEETFTKAWLDQFKKKSQYKKINPSVFEKMTYALLLLEKLAQSDIEFIFKGGTSLVLLLKDTNRFSIDIDIITTQQKASIERALDYIVENSLFTRWEEKKRDSKGVAVPKSHYKIFYSLENDLNILLDVLFEDNSYPNTISLPINCSWVSVQEPVPEVNVPCINSILGDKLTAFAPNTTGIRYNTGKHIEIIKQLYDIGKLVDNMTDFEVVKNSFQRIAHAQIAYRELDITYSEVCDDIIETAFIIAKETRNTNQDDDKIKMKEIQFGITGFQGFLMSGYFRLDEAVAASAKAGYLAAKIKTNDNFLN